MTSKREETLGPENWGEMRALCHRMLDDTMTRLLTIGDHQSSWASEEETMNVSAPLLPEGEGEEKVYEILEIIL